MSRKKKSSSRKKSSSKKPSAKQDFSWFRDSPDNQLFLWCCRPHRNQLLLAGNNNGYRQIISYLDSMLAGEKSQDIRLLVPSEGPTIQWGGSPLNTKSVASIEEIERDFKKQVSPFDGFVWYRRLMLLSAAGVSEPITERTNSSLVVKLGMSDVERWKAILTKSQFPGWGAAELASGTVDLYLSGDWLGAE